MSSRLPGNNRELFLLHCLTIQNLRSASNIGIQASHYRCIWIVDVGGLRFTIYGSKLPRELHLHAIWINDCWTTWRLSTALTQINSDLYEHDTSGDACSPIDHNLWKRKYAAVVVVGLVDVVEKNATKGINHAASVNRCDFIVMAMASDQYGWMRAYGRENKLLHSKLTSRHKPP